MNRRPKRADESSWTRDLLAYGIFGTAAVLFTWLGNALRHVDDALADLGGDE